jgi:hypothetical protein
MFLRKTRSPNQWEKLFEYDQVCFPHLGSILWNRFTRIYGLKLKMVNYKVEEIGFSVNLMTYKNFYKYGQKIFCLLIVGLEYWFENFSAETDSLNRHLEPILGLLNLQQKHRHFSRLERF